MSGYRSYVPWKPSLSYKAGSNTTVPWKPSLSYKAGSNTTYSSRDDVTTGESKSRLGLTASPATYRPSFSGGTYRSVKRDAPLIVPLQKNYGATYSSGNKLEKDEPKSAQPTAKPVPKISVQPSQLSYSGGGTSKGYDQNKSRSSSSTGSLLKYDRKSRDPSPAIDRMPSIAASRARSRDPSPLTDRRHNTGTFSSSTSNLSKFGHRSRDPSPATSDLRLGSSIQNRNNLRARSRDPSPSSIQYKNRLGASQTNYSTNYRVNPRNTKNFGSKYGTNTSSSSSNSGMADKALSYMSISDFRARSVSRTHDCVKKLEKLSIGNAGEGQKSRGGACESKDGPETSVPESNVEPQEPAEPETFIAVKVVTRGTSPTPPGSTSIVRTRRLELAKTIEKTIQRSSRRPKYVDKEMQSDRLDDTTRYSRFSAASRLSNSNWSSPLSSEPKFSRSESSKHSSTSSSASKSNKNDTESVEKKGKDEPPLQKSSSSSSRGSIKQEKSKDSTEPKTNKSSKSSSSGKTRSTETSASSRSLPPTIPKSESSTKSSTASAGAVRWPNKDFRKSALNVGPTDRPRKSRTPSTSTDTDEKCEQQKTSPGQTRLERSPSVASETGSSTSTSSSNGQTFTDDKQQMDATTLMKRNETEIVNSFGSDVEQNNENSSGSWRKSFDTRNEQQACSANEYTALDHPQSQSANVYPLTKGESSVQLVAKNEAAKSILIRKLGSISNFFATRTQDESVDETIFLDDSSSPSGGSGQGVSISGALKGDSLTTTNSTTAMVSQTQSQSYLLNPTAAITSTTNSDLDESSWWQNTSQQIDTESALDVRDEMKYKLRHIDSGEIAWWMRNENDREQGANEDDTIADDLKTLNQQNDFDTDPDRSDRTDRLLTNELKRSASRGTSPWWPTTSTRESSFKEKSPFIKRAQSGEKSWWLSDSTEEKPVEDEASQHDDSYFSDVKNTQNAVSVGSGSVNSPQTSETMGRTMTYGGNYLDGSNRYQNQKLSTVNEDSVSQFEVTSPPDSGTGPGYNIPWWMTDSPAEGEKKGALFKVKRIESGERAWWLSDSNDSSSHKNPPAVQMQPQYQPQPELAANPMLLQRNQIHRNLEQSFQLEHQPNESQVDSVFLEDEEVKRASEDYYNNIKPNTYPYANNSYYQPPPLEHRRSPEGLEDTTQANKSTLYEATNNKNTNYSSNRNNNNVASPSSEFQHGKSGTLFISRHTNIDDLLGGSCRPLSPLLNIFNGESGNGTDDLRMLLEEISPQQVRIHDSTAQMPVIQRMGRDECDYRRPSQTQLDDAAIQVYKDGDYGAYLDLESSLAEQAEEIEGLDSSRKNSLVVRTQLSVRVHAIIEKLLSSEGSELRRALFSLKQIFQEDKDLVHGFVALGGLNCLVRVGNVADQNYQNYILRALGQVMLYVDGMNGVMKHSPTIQWLYSLIASKYRLVVKTALKLLLVFVEYVETNCMLLVQAVHTVDKSQGTLPWSNIMKLLKDYENADTELLIYATSLINKTLSGLNDQDSFYDESDFLEQQGMEGVVQRYMSRPGTDLDLLDQLQLYEAVLKMEDGETDGIRIPNNSMRKTMRLRNTDSTERRKSRRHSTGTSPSISQNVSSPKRYTPAEQEVLDEDSSSSNNSNEFNGGVFRENKGQREGAGVTPGLRRRRERAERQKSFMREQQEALANGYRSPFDSSGQPNELDSEYDDKKPGLQIIRDQTVKDLTQKLKNLPSSPQEEKQQSRIGDMTGLISKAKEGLAKSKSKGDISRSPSVDQDIKKSEPKKSENELHWEELVKNMARPLTLCDLDFTDLNEDDEKDVLAPRGLGGAVPPPPPPMGGPPPIGGMGGKLLPPHFPPPPTNLVPPPNLGYGTMNNRSNGDQTQTIKKNKKTVKLFWKEVREDMIPPTVTKTIWDELPKSAVDIQKLEHLFESRAKDLMTKKQQEMNKNKEIIILDHKRSNAINIAMTKLPPPRAIKAAILKMDQTVVTREGIDKLLNMLPTDEERAKIQEAQMANPELPLGSAEQFLLTLSSISELSARLKLWAFKLDFENTEKEIAEPLNDLKQGLELLKANKTFKCILSTLLSIGVFLNGTPVKGFQIEYLAKVPEVKDTVHKHSLLHHLCHMVMESMPDTTDLYSEIGPITRASKADFTELAHNIAYLETECKASWDRLKVIAKHDCPVQLKQKLVDFLADCAERIIILEIVHRRVINRYRKFLLWLGVPQHRVAESKPNEFCRILSEFALEYRTTRERVQQQIEKKANHRERNKTRGKMIIDVGKFRTQEDRADAELKQLLGSPNVRNDNPDGTLTWRRRRAEELRSPIIKQNEESFTDGDDEILESLVKTATKAPGPRPTPRERKRTRHADRKSLKRSRTREGFTAERIAGISDL